MHKHTSVSSNIVVVLLGSDVPLPSTTLDVDVLVVGYRRALVKIAIIKLKNIVSMKSKVVSGENYF